MVLFYTNSIRCCFVPTKQIVVPTFVLFLLNVLRCQKHIRDKLYLLSMVLFYTSSIRCCFVPTQYGAVLYLLNMVLFYTNSIRCCFVPTQ